MNPPAREVIVIGAGIVGAAIAYHLARAGARVTVLERERAGAGATRHSFAWLNASFGHPREYYALRLQSLLDYRRLESELDGALEIDWCGSLLWDLGDDAALAAAVRIQRDRGYPLRLVERSALARMLPRFAGLPPHAALAALEGALEPVAATRALLAGAARAGARVRFDCTVEALRAGGDRVVGVAAGGDMLAADCVVLAAGSASAALAAQAGVRLPLDAPPGLLLYTAPVAPVLSHVVLAPGLHLRQCADGRLVAGEDFGGGAADDAEVEAQRLLGRLRRHLPGTALRIEELSIGARPTPADGFPAIGFAPHAGGLYIAVMHSGITLAAAVGRFAAEEIIDGADIALLAPYRPQRFAA